MGDSRRRSSKIRRRLAGALLAVAILLGLDLSRAPGSQLSAKALLLSIDLYQATLSPWMPRTGVHCRFEPSCSRYAEGVIRKHGALIGSAKTVWRILRCGPWTEMGTHDPA